VSTATGDVIPLSISISHSEGVGLAVAAIGDVAVGCDVERIAPHSERFVEDYFTTEEREALDLTPPPQRSTAVTLLWSAKEAALKVLKQGLRADTRSVVVEIPSSLHPHGQGAGRWLAIQVRIPGDERLEGYWLADDDFVWTIAGNQPLRLAP
jgi:4'-phosphopantetheinyl transferase